MADKSEQSSERIDDPAAELRVSDGWPTSGRVQMDSDCIFTFVHQSVLTSSLGEEPGDRPLCHFLLFLFRGFVFSESLTATKNSVF